MRRLIPLLLLCLTLPGCVSFSLGPSGSIDGDAVVRTVEALRADPESQPDESTIVVRSAPGHRVAVQATVTSDDPPATVEQSTRADGWRPTEHSR